MSNFFNLFAISIFVPTPSVLDTNKGFFIPLGILVIEAKLPILLLLMLDFFFLFKFAIYFTNLSAAFIFTPLFSYVNLCFFIYIKYVH